MTKTDAATRLANALRPHKPFVNEYPAIASVAYGEVGARQAVSFLSDTPETEVDALAGDILAET
jgi:hypothetical protein